MVAPSLLPKKAGARVKTHRRDAIKLARLLRSGDLPPVYVPAVADAAMRDLGRARADTLHELQAAQGRRTAFLLRHALRETGHAPWGPAHLRWLSEVVCPPAAPPSVLQADVHAVTEPPARLERLEQALHDHVQTWRLAPGVDALQGLRGVPGPVAVTPVAARGDLPRLANPRQRRRELGLTPAAYASGERRRQGGSTKPGNAQARRALMEGAWAYRSPAQGRRPLHLRLAKLPKPSQALSWQAQVRLCQRSRRRIARGKHAQPVVVAIARACVALLGAMAQHVPLTLVTQSLSCPGAGGNVCTSPSAAARPRCGGARAGVQRRPDTLVPRPRQAPDGRTEGGTQATESSRSHRRVFLAPPLPMENMTKRTARMQKM